MNAPLWPYPGHSTRRSVERFFFVLLSPVAAQRNRRSEQNLIAHAPADGMVTGIGAVKGLHFGAQRGRAEVMA